MPEAQALDDHVRNDRLYFNIQTAFYGEIGMHPQRQMQTLLLVGSHAVPLTVWNNLPSFVRTTDSFTSSRSQLKTYMFTRHCSQSAVRASDTLTRSFARYKFVIYLLSNFLT